VTMGDGTSYQDMVSAVDKIRGEGEHVCFVDVRFTYSAAE